MAIQQHPIPQEVASYKFRLIGDMTVKQFIWLASGIVLGLLFYSLPLPFFFKYPLAAIAVAIGAGTAFVPIQGRPMDKWIIAFIRSIYSPTQYVWQKSDSQGPAVSTPKTPAPVAPKAVTTPVPQTAVLTPSVPVPAPNPAPVPVPATPTSVAPSKVVIPETELIKADTTHRNFAPQPIINQTEPAKETATFAMPQRPVAVPSPQVNAPTESRLPIPFTPTTGNTLVGMTLNQESKILPGALIEIRSKGNTIRATKSNQLGQFLFAKPLENGLFQIVTEKEGFKFDTYSINLTGQIVKPLKLQAK